MAAVSGRRWPAVLIVILFLAAVAGAALTGWRFARESPPHQGPIILVSVDGLSAGRLPQYGADRSDTPAVDALASDAIVFDRAYTHSPSTLPAHASLLSGLLPFEHGVRDDVGFALNEDVRTLAELLAARGFETAAVVSTALLGDTSGIAQGFSFFETESPATEHQSASPRESGTAADVAEQWMRTQGDQRFFLFIQVDDTNFEPTVERLVTHLTERGLYDESTMVLIGDHGDAEAPALADTSLHVPFIVKQPDSAGAGRRVTQSVQHVDVLPTILDLVRAPIPGRLVGRSLRSILEGEDDNVVSDRPIYAESLAAFYRLGSYPAYGLTRGDLRLVRGERDEVFDLRRGGPSLPEDAQDVGRLRTVLDGLLADRRIEMPLDTTGDETTIAVLGYLPGPRLDVAEPVTLSTGDELALLQSHRHAATLVGEERFAAAIDRLQGITRRHPELAVVHFQIGHWLSRVGRVPEAIAAFDRAQTLAPDSPNLRLAQARVYLRANDVMRATERAELAVALAERHRPEARAATREMAARVALARGDADAAVRHAEALEQLDPDVPMGLFVRGRLAYEEGRYAEALDALQEADTIAGEHERAIEDLHFHIGESLVRLERQTEAESQFVEELRLFPRSLRTYASLVMLYHALDRPEDIERVTGEMTRAVPTPEGYARAAQLWTLVGDRARANAVIADARVRFRGDPSLVLLERRR